MFVDINWYGQLSILCKYLNTRLKIPFASIQHGYLNINQIKKQNLRYLRIAPLLVWNKKIEEKLHQKKDFNVLTVGAPFIYIKTKQNLKPKGTLLMFLHSENELKQKKISKKILQNLKKKYPKPHKLALFYLDYTEENIKYYKQNGFDVVTFGSRKDLNHLENLFKTLNSVEYFLTNYIGSAFLYALYLKKKTKLLNYKYKFKVVISKKKFFISYFNNLTLKKNKIFKKYNNLKYIPIKIGFKIAYEELGVKYKKSTNELKKVLGFDSFWKKILALIFLKIRLSFYQKKN